jgi:hypothetical protein
VYEELKHGEESKLSKRKKLKKLKLKELRDWENGAFARCEPVSSSTPPT